MSDKKNINQNWRELCEAAAKEHDPQKLRELVRKINDALTPESRSGMVRREDALSPRDEERKAGVVGLTDWLKLEKLCSGFAQVCVPSPPLSSRRKYRRVQFMAGAACGDTSAVFIARSWSLEAYFFDGVSRDGIGNRALLPFAQLTTEIA